MTDVAAVPRTVMLTCHAEHPDRRRRGDPCGRTLYVGSCPSAVQFVVTSTVEPEGPENDGTFWLQCPRKQCARWNRFRFVVPGVTIV